MKDQFQAFQERDAKVLVISFEKLDGLEHHEKMLGLPYPLASDPDRTAYQSYGLTSGTFSQILHPRTIWKYAKLIFLEGMRMSPLSRGNDRFQLGGDFVIDDSGLITFAHRSCRPDDRPTVSSLIAALDR